MVESCESKKKGHYAVPNMTYLKIASATLSAMTIAVFLHGQKQPHLDKISIAAEKLRNSQINPEISEDSVSKNPINLETVFEDRRKHLISTCKKFKNTRPLALQKSNAKNWPGLFLNYINADKKSENFKNSLACFIPKAGSTSWKRVFNAIHSGTTIETEGPIRNGEFYQDFYLKLPRFDSVPKYRNQKIERIDYSTWDVKFIAVRHPFTRLYSAWKDKFFHHPDSQIKGYNEILSGKEWVSYIVKMKKYEAKIKNSEFVHKPTNAKISFDSFLKSILENSSFRNMHWGSYYSECWPCDVPYNYISKLENINEEADFIMEKINAPARIGTFPKTNHHSTGKNDVDKVAEVFRKYDKEFVMSLYEKFRVDFELFGYDIDGFVKTN